MRKKNIREILRAAWDFFVLFSGISTASNLTRTQGRRVRSVGLFLVRPREEKLPPRPPQRPTDPEAPSGPPPSIPGEVLLQPHEPQPVNQPQEKPALATEPKRPLVAAPIVLRFWWESKELLKITPDSSLDIDAARLLSAGHPGQLAPEQGPVELKI